MTPSVDDASIGSVPPIVLLIEDDRDTLEMYSTYLESEGVWVATATDPIGGYGQARELRPNLLVTDIGFGGQASGADLVHAVKQDVHTAHIPVIVLSGTPLDRLPARTQREADLVLLKPVLPDELLARGRELMTGSAGLRARSIAALEHARRLHKENIDVRGRLKDTVENIGKRARPCPGCGSPIGWLERGVINGVEYDYHGWCVKGCGLYCYERRAGRWIKLA